MGPRKGLNMVSRAFQTILFFQKYKLLPAWKPLQQPGSPATAEVQQAAAEAAPQHQSRARQALNTVRRALGRKLCEREAETSPREFRILTLKQCLTSPGSWQHQCQQPKTKLSFNLPNISFNAFPQTDLTSSLPKLQA